MHVDQSTCIVRRYTLTQEHWVAPIDRFYPPWLRTRLFHQIEGDDGDFEVDYFSQRYTLGLGLGWGLQISRILPHCRPFVGDVEQTVPTPHAA